MCTLPKTFLTPEQYLELERTAEYKNEYREGEMVAMTGANHDHCLVAGNLIASLVVQLRSRPCYAFPSLMRIRSASGLYTYADVSVVSGDTQFEDAERDTLVNPTLIAEVLSPSTEAYDRGRKFERYQSIASLQEYLLVTSDRVHADLYTRQADDRWILTPADGQAATLSLESIGCRLVLADLYEKVDLEGVKASIPAADERRLTPITPESFLSAFICVHRRPNSFSAAQ